MKSILKRLKKLSRTTIIISIIVVIVLIGIGIVFAKSKNKAYQFVTVTRNSIVETVSVTGNTTPVSSVSLGFGSSGNISRVYFSVGDSVKQGQLLASLNTSDLSSQIKQAQANIDAQVAKLQGLQSGSRPEDIAASQASLQKAQQDLANMYASVGDTSTDSYAKANDAVRVQLGPLFTNSETNNPKLSYQTSNSSAQTNAETQRQVVTDILNKWQGQLAVSDQSATSINTSLQNDVSYLVSVRKLLSNVSDTLQYAVSLSGDTLAGYKASVTAAINEVNTATKNINTASQNIASQKLIVSQLQAQLDLKKAGSTPEDIQAQQAQVKSAQAALQSVQAKLQNSQIVAPISGVITQLDAKVGQFASPGTSLISIISTNAFEIDALVSETDVGKIALNNKVSMTLDAFPGETFTGLVSYIDPAQTTIQGVVGYKIKVNFDNVDSRMKSGLTVNLDITTRQKENVLILPQYAILQNDEGTFVETVENGVTKDVPITLGLQDQEGNVEITSGVTEGEQVLNIGLKQK
jgi:HlyD family secretion protein